MTDARIKPQTTGRVEFLDSARGVAAWSVLIFHTILTYNFEIADTRLPAWQLATLKVFFNGSEAVSFFFVLSGFVLASSLKDLRDDFYFPNYILKRLLRIYPLYIVAVSIAFFLSSDRRVFYFLQELLLTSGVHRLIPPGWTMGIEVLLSLFMPVLVITLRDHRVFYSLVVLMLFSYRYVSPFLFHFLLGIWIHDLYRSGRTVERLNKGAELWVILPTCLLLYSLRQLAPLWPRLEYAINGFQDLIGMDRDIIYFYFSGVASAVFILLILQSARLQSFLNHHFLAFIGRISFSLYLLHSIIIKAFHFDKLKAYFPTIGLLPTMVVLVSLATIIVSYFSYKFIELPFMNLARKADARKYVPQSWR
ncbi:MAG: acyltransferase [Bacteroidetes bacterium]|nr:acyltransferase [Bacteroidota bacterium]